MIRHHRVLTTAAIALLVAAPACAQKYQAERDGKDAGEAICDVRNAESVEEAANAAAELEDELDSLSDQVAVFTAEDRLDITENLRDLAEHASQGNDVLAQQDLTVILRSLENIKDDLDDTGQAAIDGMRQGLDDCVNG